MSALCLVTPVWQTREGTGSCCPAIAWESLQRIWDHCGAELWDPEWRDKNQWILLGSLFDWQIKGQLFAALTYSGSAASTYLQRPSYLTKRKPVRTHKPWVLCSVRSEKLESPAVLSCKLCSLCLSVICSLEGSFPFPFGTVAAGGSLSLLRVYLECKPQTEINNYLVRLSKQYSHRVAFWKGCSSLRSSACGAPRWHCSGSLSVAAEAGEQRRHADQTGGGRGSCRIQAEEDHHNRSDLRACGGSPEALPR